MTTTSRLSTHAFELTANDLQVLKDYALEAPHEWRLLLERLIEVAEDEHDYDELDIELQDLRDEHDDLKKAAKEAYETAQKHFKTFHKLLDKTLGEGPSKLRDQFESLEGRITVLLEEMVAKKTEETKPT